MNRDFFKQYTGGREIVFYAQVGSVNYNLHDENSDQDFKVYVLPSFEDLYSGNRLSKQYKVDDIDFTVHDIRDLEKHLWKANINFIETLFSVNSDLKEKVPELYEMREELATMNLPYLYEGCVGMYKRISKRDDGKSTMTRMRLNDFLMRLSSGRKFEDAFRYDEDDRNGMLAIKQANLKDTREKVDVLHEQMVKGSLTKEWYKTRKVNEEAKDKLNQILVKLVKGHLVK